MINKNPHENLKAAPRMKKLPNKAHSILSDTKIKASQQPTREDFILDGIRLSSRERSTLRLRAQLEGLIENKHHSPINHKRKTSSKSPSNELSLKIGTLSPRINYPSFYVDKDHDKTINQFFQQMKMREDKSLAKARGILEREIESPGPYTSLKRERVFSEAKKRVILPVSQYTYSGYVDPVITLLADTAMQYQQSTMLNKRPQAQTPAPSRPTESPLTHKRNNSFTAPPRTRESRRPSRKMSNLNTSGANTERETKDISNSLEKGYLTARPCYNSNQNEVREQSRSRASTPSDRNYRSTPKTATMNIRHWPPASSRPARCSSRDNVEGGEKSNLLRNSSKYSDNLHRKFFTNMSSIQKRSSCNSVIRTAILNESEKNIYLNPSLDDIKNQNFASNRPNRIEEMLRDPCDQLNSPSKKLGDVKMSLLNTINQHGSNLRRKKTFTKHDSGSFNHTISTVFSSGAKSPGKGGYLSKEKKERDFREPPHEFKYQKPGLVNIRKDHIKAAVANKISLLSKTNHEFIARDDIHDVSTSGTASRNKETFAKRNSKIDCSQEIEMPETNIFQHTMLNKKEDNGIRLNDFSQLESTPTENFRKTSDNISKVNLLGATSLAKLRSTESLVQRNPVDRSKSREKRTYLSRVISTTMDKPSERVEPSLVNLEN